MATGWLGGLSDQRIARALRAIHEKPGQQWRIETLVGRSPLRYQNEWRLPLAKSMLSRRGGRIGEIGFAIGYESQAAFSRAYKAFFDRSPRDDLARTRTDSMR